MPLSNQLPLSLLVVVGLSWVGGTCGSGQGLWFSLQVNVLPPVAQAMVNFRIDSAQTVQEVCDFCSQPLVQYRGCLVLRMWV